MRSVAGRQRQAPAMDERWPSRLRLFGWLAALTLAVPRVPIIGGLTAEQILPPLLAFLGLALFAGSSSRGSVRIGMEVRWLFSIAALTGVSAVAASSTSALMAGPVRWTLTAVIVYVAYRGANTGPSAEALLKPIALVAIFEAAFGLSAYALNWNWEFIGIDRFKGYESVASTFHGRISGTLNQAATFVAGAFCLALPICLGFALERRGRSRILWLAGTAMVGAALFLTLARVPMVLGGLACVAVLGVRRPLLAALGATFGLALFYLTPIKERFLNDGNDRAQLWYAAWNMFRHNILTGVGPGQYIERLPEYSYTPYGYVTNTAHNSVLLMAAESGLFAAVFLILAISAALRGVLRSPRAVRPVVLGAGAGLLAFVVDALTTNLFFIPTVAISAWVTAVAVKAALWDSRETIGGDAALEVDRKGRALRPHRHKRANAAPLPRRRSPHTTDVPVGARLTGPP